MNTHGFIRSFGVLAIYNNRTVDPYNQIKSLERSLAGQVQFLLDLLKLFVEFLCGFYSFFGLFQIETNTGVIPGMKSVLI